MRVTGTTANTSGVGRTDEITTMTSFREIKDEAKNVKTTMLRPRRKHGELPRTCKKGPTKTCRDAESIAEMKRFAAFNSVSVTAEH